MATLSVSSDSLALVSRNVYNQSMINKFLITLILLTLLFSACQTNSASAPDRKEDQRTSNNKRKTPDSTTSPPTTSTSSKTSEPTKNSNAAQVSQAIDIVLGRKSSNPTAERNAVNLLKDTLAVKELRDNRDQRKDKSLLNDRYPKDTQILVGRNKDVAYWTAYDRSHFAARHLIETFDTSNIKAKNSWWPAGTTLTDIDRYLQLTLEKYNSRVFLPNAQGNGTGFKYFDLDLPDNSGISVQVGIQSDGRVTSFFPTRGPNVISVTDNEVRKLLNVVRGGH